MQKTFLKSVCCLLFLGSLALPAHTSASRISKGFSACQKYFVIPDFLNSLTRTQETALQSLAHIYVGILTGEPASSNLEQLKIQLNESLMQWSEILRQEGYPQSSIFVRDAFLYKVRELLESKDPSLLMQSARMAVERNGQLLHMKKTHEDKVKEQRLQAIFDKYGVDDINYAFAYTGLNMKGPADLESFRDLELLLQFGADVNFIKNGISIFSALIQAVRKNNTEIVKLLIKWNANLELEYKNLVALSWAETPEMVELLLAAGANLEAMDDNGKTPLFINIMRKETVVRMLIEKGANIDHVTDQGETLLMLASHWGIIDIVKYVISKGANLNAVDHNGDTALMYATAQSMKDVVKLLLESGADANIYNKKKKLAYTIARQKADPTELLPLRLMRPSPDLEILQILKPYTNFDSKYTSRRIFNYVKTQLFTPYNILFEIPRYIVSVVPQMMSYALIKYYENKIKKAKTQPTTPPAPTTSQNPTSKPPTETQE